jgi:NADH dehydrogenase [ubiquinone] 1 alpha subcomplex assembly factor 7
VGSLYEWRSDTIALEIGRRVRTDGAALIIDYGHAWYGLGETLQAVAGHSFTDPLRSPGEADLTAHVDFAALAQSAEIIGGRIHGPISQRDLLRGLGIDNRAAALKDGRAGEGSRDRPSPLASDRDRAPRHGRVIQGARHRRPEARSAAGL